MEIKPTQKGRLGGLKFAVKDVIDVKGYKTGCGNPKWLSQQLISKEHAVCVKRLLANGASCIGKSVLGEFCSGSTGINHFYGMPLNPKAQDRVPGGSSSGSASIVASGEVDFALGTDSAGSVRVPASFCGIYGMRPSHGIISMSGVKIFTPSFDTIGIFSRTMDIIALVFEALIEIPIEKYCGKVTNFYILEDLFDFVPIYQRKIFYQFIYESCEILKLQPTFIKLVDIHIDANKPDIGIGDLFKKILCSEIWATIGSWIKKEKLQFSKTTYVDFSFMENIDKTTLWTAFNRKELYFTKLNELLSLGSLVCIPSSPDVAPFREKFYNKVNEFNYEKLRPLIALSGLGKLPQINIPLEVDTLPPLGISLLSGNNQDNFLIQSIKKIIDGKPSFFLKKT
ncbi:aspartyl/glutamyl-tRNA amidotransferase subunit A [Legionella busanensis]|uniref:Aspartyl/glutamyl-tRNA amidotransferase subunit A n=1 Tax=Legionella busanensis TaxID=190655 RepID=A0A378KID5_9GAMM|nr:amidase family protein [Legionella busanensis]STX81554.1 aspartyl/glutamyl-tRNA amidotransferase subunit A [Legionella busanensis]